MMDRFAQFLVVFGVALTMYSFVVVLSLLAGA